MDPSPSWSTDTTTPKAIFLSLKPSTDVAEFSVPSGIKTYFSDYSMRYSIYRYDGLAEPLQKVLFIKTTGTRGGWRVEDHCVGHIGGTRLMLTGARKNRPLIAETRLVLTTLEYPPLTFANPAGKHEITGIATEVVREIMERTGNAKYEIRILPWQRADGQNPGRYLCLRNDINRIPATQFQMGRSDP